MLAPERANARNELIGFATKLTNAANKVTDDSPLREVSDTLTEVENGIEAWRGEYLDEPKLAKEATGRKAAPQSERTR